VRRGASPPERWNPPPPSPRAAEAAVELVSVVGAEAPSTESLVEVLAGPRRCRWARRWRPRALEEEEAGLLQPEVSSTSSLRP
jgi:hypothetical protein